MRSRTARILALAALSVSLSLAGANAISAQSTDGGSTTSDSGAMMHDNSGNMADGATTADQDPSMSDSGMADQGQMAPEGSTGMDDQHAVAPADGTMTGGDSMIDSTNGDAMTSQDPSMTDDGMSQDTAGMQP